jgi:hypothetical protein
LTGLAWLIPLTLTAVTAALWNQHSLEEFARRAAPVAMAESEWLERGWSALPAYRIGVFGHPNQALALQWASPLREIRAELGRNGWSEARPPNPKLALGIVNPEADIPQLPVLPHFNQAEPDALRMIKPVSGGRWLIARFWDSGYALRDGAAPIWLCGVAFLEAREWFGLMRFADETGGADREAAALLGTELGARILLRTGEGGRTTALVKP